MRNLASSQPAARLAGLLVLALPFACAPKALPDPRAAASTWARAVERRDADAAYAMLTRAARRAQGRRGVTELLEQHRKELLAKGQATASARARVETQALLTFGDDRAARVVVEQGRFRVAAAGALPAAAETPLDAVRELRDVLARRSYAGLLRVLSRDAAHSLEAGVQDLVDAMDEPSTLEIQIEGRRATARLPGGHKVELIREDGVWRVANFD